MKNGSVKTDIAHTALTSIRDEFPLLDQKLGKYPLVYLDNAATTQKPLSVIRSIETYYSLNNANIHRGVHQIATRATEAFEQSRETIRDFIHAKESAEIVFTSGTTDSINLVAQSLGRSIIGKGDEILISGLEHHSNIVPWQMLCEEKGAVLRVIPVTESGEWDMSQLDGLLNSSTRLVAVNHVSNSLGTINPVRDLIARAHAAGALVLLDGAQAVSHFPVDVQELDCDFYCFSGHKLYGPTGTGVLYGKLDLLREMPPWKGGGEMIKTVRFEKTTYNDPPYRFEAGTPNIEGVIALGAAVQFVQSLSWDDIHSHEQQLLESATQRLLALDGISIYGTSSHKVGVLSFLADGVHPYDLGTLLDSQGIAVRTGHHCTQPLWDQYGVPGTVRASFAIYNTTEEIDLFGEALEKALSMLR